MSIKCLQNKSTILDAMYFIARMSFQRTFQMKNGLDIYPIHLNIKLKHYRLTLEELLSNDW